MLCNWLYVIKIIENSTVQRKMREEKSQRLHIDCCYTKISVAFDQIIHVSFVQYNFFPSKMEIMFYIRSHLSFNVCSLDFKLLFQLTSSEKSQLFGVCTSTSHCISNRYYWVNHMYWLHYTFQMTSQLPFFNVLHSIYPYIYISFSSLSLFIYSNACWNERPLAKR